MNRKQLIKKFLDGHLSQEEFELLVNLLSQEEPGQDIDAALHKIWENAEYSNALSPADSQRLLSTYKEKRGSIQKSGRQVWTTKVWYNAAAMAGLLLTGIAIWMLLGQNQMTEYTTGNGETRSITLPDSSEVTLNANSYIKFNSEWDEKSPRKVWLDGEAYFSVVHTANNQKFLVQVTDALQVEVLGTEFNVRERREKTQVVLQEGKVQLTLQSNEDEPQKLSMDPGDLIEFSENDNTLSKKHVNPELYSAWKNNKIIFDKTSLREVSKQLEDIYGVSILIEGDNLANTRLSGAFPTDDLDMILTSLQTIIDIEILKKGEEITISK